jgi:hypothetical protein
MNCLTCKQLTNETCFNCDLAYCSYACQLSDLKSHQHICAKTHGERIRNYVKTVIKYRYESYKGQVISLTNRYIDVDGIRMPIYLFSGNMIYDYCTICSKPTNYKSNTFVLNIDNHYIYCYQCTDCHDKNDILCENTLILVNKCCEYNKHKIITLLLSLNNQIISDIRYFISKLVYQQLCCK